MRCGVYAASSLAVASSHTRVGHGREGKPLGTEYLAQHRLAQSTHRSMACLDCIIRFIDSTSRQVVGGSGDFTLKRKIEEAVQVRPSTESNTGMEA